MNDASGPKLARTTRVLFICSRNRLRSPTAEQVFARWPRVETASAGLAPDAEECVTAELLQWADLVFVMEKKHRSRLTGSFKAALKDRRVVCLDIPDDFQFMQPELVALLKARVSPHLPG
jgi:predicted protein tyrosine phosphatase